MNMARWIERYAAYNLPIFPCHTPLTGGGQTCSCEAWRHTEECRHQRPRLYLPPDKHCTDAGKHPRIAGWQEQSTTDPGILRAWWTRWKQANIGLDCDKARLLVVDLDTYKDSYSAPRFKLNEETVTVLTGGGGTHLWYRQPDDVQFGSRKGQELPAGIDIRGSGNLIILPPSLHRSGRRYQFEAGYSPGDIAVAPLPDVLHEILEKAQRRGRPYSGRPAVADSDAVRRSQTVVERVLAAGEIGYAGPHAWMGDGLVYILDQCPFNAHNLRGELHPADQAAFVTIDGAGAIAAGCHHARCQEAIIRQELAGWHWLRQLVSIRLAAMAG